MNDVNPASPEAGGGENVTLKMHMTVGNTDPMYLAAEEFKSIVEERTEGNVIVELYASSALGNTSDCLEGLKLRICDIVFDSVANLSSIDALANIDGAPYLYTNVEHYRTVWEGELGQEIMGTIGEKTDKVLLGAALLGTRVITSTSPVRSVEDAKGLKIRVPTIPIYTDTWTWLGASPTPLAPGELFTALQQGTVSAQENPYATNVGLSFQEVCGYVTETNHIYSTLSLMFDRTFYYSLPEDTQVILADAATEACKFGTDKNLEMVVEKKQVFVDAGAEIITVDIAEWQQALDGFLEEKYPDLVEWADEIAQVGV